MAIVSNRYLSIGSFCGASDLHFWNPWSPRRWTSRSQNETNAAEVAPPRTGISLAWRALRHRNFRLFFGGQSISLIGTWMTRIATAWLVYRLTGSAWLLGIVGFCGQIPTFLLAPFAGVWVDRLNRRHVSGCDANPGHGAVAGAGRADVDPRRHHYGNSLAQHFPGHDQCVRHARATGFYGADD